MNTRLRKLRNYIRSSIWMTIGFIAILLKTIIQWLPIYSIILFGSLVLWHLTSFTGVRDGSGCSFYGYMLITMGIPNIMILLKAWADFDKYLK